MSEIATALRREGVDLIRWEAELEPGDAVRIRWGYGLGFRASGRAEIVRINRMSFRVRLTAPVPSPYGPRVSDGWRPGQEFRIPRAISRDWHPDHCVEPLEPER